MTKSTEASFLGQSDEMSREAGDIIDLLDEIILNANAAHNKIGSLKTRIKDIASTAGRELGEKDDLKLMKLCGAAGSALGWIEAMAEEEGPESRHWHYHKQLKDALEEMWPTKEQSHD